MILYGTECPLCVDVPLNTYPFIHSFSPVAVITTVVYNVSAWKNTLSVT